jgi:hypothetical protein
MKSIRTLLSAFALALLPTMVSAQDEAALKLLNS